MKQIKQTHKGSGDNVGGDKIVSLDNSKVNKKELSLFDFIVGLATIGGVVWGVYTYYNKSTDKTMDIIQTHFGSGDNVAGDKIIITDKESLGIREPNGLYQNNKKVGLVVGFDADDNEENFTISSIKYDQPLRDSNMVFQPYEFENYLIQIKHIENLVTQSPPGAEGVGGIILKKR